VCLSDHTKHEVAEGESRKPPERRSRAIGRSAGDGCVHVQAGYNLAPFFPKCPVVNVALCILDLPAGPRRNRCSSIPIVMPDRKIKSARDIANRAALKDNLIAGRTEQVGAWLAHRIRSCSSTCPLEPWVAQGSPTFFRALASDDSSLSGLKPFSTFSFFASQGASGASIHPIRCSRTCLSTSAGAPSTPAPVSNLRRFL
jgi:hypothetical protein